MFTPRSPRSRLLSFLLIFGTVSTSLLPNKSKWRHMEVQSQVWRFDMKKSLMFLMVVSLTISLKASCCWSAPQLADCESAQATVGAGDDDEPFLQGRSAEVLTAASDRAASIQQTQQGPRLLAQLRIWASSVVLKWLPRQIYGHRSEPLSSRLE
jgi:hypothetical protein